MRGEEIGEEREEGEEGRLRGGEGDGGIRTNAQRRGKETREKRGGEKREQDIPNVMVLTLLCRLTSISGCFSRAWATSE